jgi:sec-independent protein translocase protein TatA
MSWPTLASLAALTGEEGASPSCFCGYESLGFRHGGRRSARLALETEICVMGGLSIWHWLIVGAVMLMVFGGKGKISDIMGDVAKGIKSFKKGLAEEDQKPEVERPIDPPMRTIDHQTAADPAKIPDTRKLG